MLVVTEYSIEVAVVQRSPESGIFSLAGIGPATKAGALAGDSAAEIALAADGRHAYVGVRGSNRISVLAVDADGAPSARWPTSPAAVTGRGIIWSGTAGCMWPRTLRGCGDVSAGPGERAPR